MARTTKDEEAEFDYAAAVGKPTSNLQMHLTDWIKEKTGVTFSTKKEEAAFDLGVKLTVQFRMRHQASQENQERLADELAAREEREAEKARQPKEPKKAKAEPEAEPEEKPTKKAPAKKAAPAPAEKAAPAKRGGRRPKPATADQPF